MRDRYYRLRQEQDVPRNGVLVRIYASGEAARSRIDGDLERAEAAPDLMLFRAALARLHDGLVGIFVLLETEDLWQDEWGDLVDYRGGRGNAAPKPARGAVIAAPLTGLPLKTGEAGIELGLCRDVLEEAWDYTLNLNSMTSPSLTT